MRAISSPEDPVAHNYLGLTYENLGRQQEAIAAYKQAIAYKADYAEAHYNLGLLYVSLGDRNQAEAEYNVLKSLNSDLADVLFRKLNQLN
jgi:Flp pilus assembly protein TadD